MAAASGGGGAGGGALGQDGNPGSSQGTQWQQGWDTLSDNKEQIASSSTSMPSEAPAAMRTPRSLKRRMSGSISGAGDQGELDPPFQQEHMQDSQESSATPWKHAPAPILLAQRVMIARHNGTCKACWKPIQKEEDDIAIHDAHFGGGWVHLDCFRAFADRRAAFEAQHRSPLQLPQAQAPPLALPGPWASQRLFPGAAEGAEPAAAEGAASEGAEGALRVVAVPSADGAAPPEGGLPEAQAGRDIIGLGHGRDGGGGAEGFSFSQEQKDIIGFKARQGDIVVVRAYAGTGKTTTAAGLIEELISANPRPNILYVVFNKSAQEEMEGRLRESVQLGYLTVKTCNAAAKGRVFRGCGPGYEVTANLFEPDEVVEVLKLQRYVDNAKVRNADKQKGVARRLAKFILTTLDRFLYSVDLAPHLRHVPRAFDTQSPEGKALIKESFTSMEIVDCAKKLWNKVKERRHDRRGPLSHDAYQKQCQLGFDGFRAAENDLSVCAFCGPEYSGDVTSASCNASYSDRRAWRPHCRRCGRRVAWGTPAFDVVIVDEAQDLAPVQFDLFARGILHPLQPRKDARPGMLASEPGRGPTLYFVGDPCQLIYGWRGARGNAFQGGFRPHVSAFFSLTGSYRFGPEVGEIATRLLRWMGEEASLQGLGGSTEVRYTAGEADGVCSPAGAPYRVRLRSNNNDGRAEADDEDGVELREVTLKELSSECRDRFGCCLTVLCRTNKEIARTVLAAVVVEGVAGMPKFLVRRGASKILNPQHMKRFVDLFHGRIKHVTVDGMLFSSWAEMRQWAEDSEDASLQLLMEMVEEYEAPLPPSTEEEGQEEAPGRRFGGGGLIRLLELLQPFVLKEEDGLGGDGGYQIEMSTTHQAKGRSIPAVLVADDFRSPYKPPKGGPPGAPWVPLEEGEQVTHPFWKEESNLVYVAVTRAQKVLFCNSGVSRFLRENVLGGHCGPGLQARAEEIFVGLDKRRAAHERRFASWWALDPRPLHPLERIPFPDGPRMGNLLHVHFSMENPDCGRYIKHEASRWHPDKWMPRLASVEELHGVEARRALEAELLSVMQNINRLRKEFYARQDPPPPRRC